MTRKGSIRATHVPDRTASRARSRSHPSHPARSRRSWPAVAVRRSAARSNDSTYKADVGGSTPSAPTLVKAHVVSPWLAGTRLHRAFIARRPADLQALGVAERRGRGPRAISITPQPASRSRRKRGRASGSRARRPRAASRRAGVACSAVRRLRACLRRCVGRCRRSSRLGCQMRPRPAHHWLHPVATAIRPATSVVIPR
jgi:hypothetical protein